MDEIWNAKEQESKDTQSEGKLVSGVKKKNKGKDTTTATEPESALPPTLATASAPALRATVTV